MPSPPAPLPKGEGDIRIRAQLPMPEILILCEYPTLNGGERSMLATLDGVRAGGFSPAAIAPPDGPLADGVGRSRHRIDPVSVPRGGRDAHRSEPAPRAVGRNSSLPPSRSAARQQPGDGKTFGAGRRGLRAAEHRPSARHRSAQCPGRCRSEPASAAAGGFRRHT